VQVTDGIRRSQIWVEVGRDAAGAKDQGAEYLVEDIRVLSNSEPWPADVAVIKLKGFNSGLHHAMPLAFEGGVVNDASGVTLYGYGATRVVKKGKKATLEGEGTLHKSPDHAFIRQPACDDEYGHVCFRVASETRAMGGDSGGPWLRWESGSWQLIGVLHGCEPFGCKYENPPGTEALATSVLADPPGDNWTSVREWIRTYAGIPDVPAGTIVRDDPTGNSWLVGDDGYRRWIPDGAVYTCLVDMGHPVSEYVTKQILIDTIPDRVGTHATCGGPEECAELANSVWKSTHLDPAGGLFNEGEFSFDENGVLTAFDRPAYNVEVDCDSIRFSIDPATITMSGTFDATRQHITGSWYIGDQLYGAWLASRVSPQT
jgi:hypothetical protein